MTMTEGTPDLVAAPLVLPNWERATGGRMNVHANRGRRWLTFGLTDEDTAACALQHWLTRL